MDGQSSAEQLAPEPVQPGEEAQLAREPGPPEEEAQPARERESAWVAPVLLLAMLAFFYLVRSILPPFIIAAALAYLFSPLVAWIQKRGRLPRPLAVLAVMVMGLGPLAVLFWRVEPSLAQETSSLVTDAQGIITNTLTQLFGGESLVIMGQTINADSVLRYLLRTTENFLGTPSQAIRAAATAVEALLDAFLALVLLFYFLLDPRPFSRFATRLMPGGSRVEWQRIGHEINGVLARYVRGLLFLVLLMSVATWLGLTLIFHLPYALPIAVATGFLEIIPFLGPVAAATIACVVALSRDGLNLALGVALFYLVLRQLEDQVVMPQVIGRSVELHPAVAIFAVLSGTAIGGILGALLAIPLAAAVKITLDHWRPADME